MSDLEVEQGRTGFHYPSRREATALPWSLKKGHLQGARPHRPSPPQPTPAGYLGSQAQLVDGVLSLGILGEELVVVLLRERDSKVVTCPGSSLWGPSQGTYPAEGTPGSLKVKHLQSWDLRDPFGLMCHADPCGQILECPNEAVGQLPTSPCTVPSDESGGRASGLPCRQAQPHRRGLQLPASRFPARPWAPCVRPTPVFPTAPFAALAVCIS